MSGTFIPPTGGSFAGMSQTALQAALASAQQALIDLSAGVKEATVSYGMGGETRSVTYSRTKVEDVRRLIQELQRALGMPAGRRGAIAVNFGEGRTPWRGRGRVVVNP
jgi:hypothetical protein